MKKIKNLSLVFLLALTSIFMLVACSNAKEEVVEEQSEEISAESEDVAEVEEKEEEPSEEEAPVESKDMGEDLYDYTLEVDGAVVKVPMMASDLADLGFVCDDDEEMLLDPNRYTPVYYKKGECLVSFNIANFGMNQESVKNCVVVGVKTDSYDAKGATVRLAKGIELGKSTLDDVHSAFGTPTDHTDRDSLSFDTYEETLDAKAEFQYDRENNDVLCKIELRNFAQPEESANNESSKNDEVDTENVPEIVSTYKAPTSISDDLHDYTFEYAGDCYTFPAPVSEFINKGWKIVESDTEEIIEGSGSGKVTLIKDNQSFWTYVRNYDKNATAAENCYVTKLRASVSATDVSFDIGQGIKIGGKEDAVTNLKGYDVEKLKDRTGYNEYEIKDDRSRIYKYNIICREGKITSIEASYEPKVDEYRQEMGL